MSVPRIYLQISPQLDLEDLLGTKEIIVTMTEYIHRGGDFMQPATLDARSRVEESGSACACAGSSQGAGWGLVFFLF